MQALGGENMGLDALEDRHQRGGAGAHLIGKGRQAQRHAFSPVALGLAVQRLMLTELLEQQHGHKVGTDPAARRDVEWRRRLADRLAIAAELLTDVLDHFHWRGVTSSVSVTSSPSLEEARDAAARQAQGAGSTMRSRGR